MTPMKRSVLIVKPTMRFLSWLRALDRRYEKMTLDELHAKQTVYLIPQSDNEQATIEHLWDYCGAIFCDQLKQWTKDVKQFPKDISWTAFSDWFEIEVTPKVTDASHEAETCDRLGRTDWLKRCRWPDAHFRCRQTGQRRIRRLSGDLKTFSQRRQRTRVGGES
jgi:hypothetical protein